ncbi:MAG TPA: hypothetical protein VL856_05990 [Acidimicrobiia bacterium]|jgi:hypothetical protein|nr:hypothetical protein [Acidimicrobiia bacterium]
MNGSWRWTRRGVAVVGPVLALGLVAAGAALGAGNPKPSMEVLPKTTGLKYSQTVTIKAHHLPKGSGTVAATICGLENAAGRKIASPTADDCAGASEVGKLVQVKSWQSNGEFQTQYTLPKSGQKFGKNSRYCDKKHHCALVVADANPDHPAYHVDKVIQFVDQQPFGSSGTTPTTKKAPKPTTTTTTTVPPPLTFSESVSGNASQSDPEVKVDAHAAVHPSSPGTTLPALPAPGGGGLPPAVAQGLGQVCTQLTSAVKQAGGDPTALAAACTSAANGDPSQAQALLQSPNLLCVAGASAWQNNEQVTDACNEAATTLVPVTSALGGALAPAFGSM